MSLARSTFDSPSASLARSAFLSRSDRATFLCGRLEDLLARPVHPGFQEKTSLIPDLAATPRRQHYLESDDLRFQISDRRTQASILLDTLMIADNHNTELQRAAATLTRGGLVAIPTETVYGLAANALDAHAVAKIFAAKDRPFFDPLIVHLADVTWWPRVVRDFPPLARKLADRFWPGPLTLILPKSDAVPDLVTSGMPTVGIRVPDHPLTQKLLRLADLPVAAPSANPFGRLSPTTAEHVRHQLGSRVDMILDGGPCRVGVESTIIQLLDDEATLLRPGGIPLEEIEALIGPVRRPDRASQEKPAAPGMLDSHYAPRTKLKIIDAVPQSPPSPRAGLIVLSDDLDSDQFAAVEVLSSAGDLVEAAANFFQALHRLDQLQLDVILALPFPERGLGRALNDRLRRAAHC